MNAEFDQRLRNELASLSGARRLRRLRPFRSDGEYLITNEGHRLIDTSSNDYLGLSHHPEVKGRAAGWALELGAGAPASRLVTGTRERTLVVEQRLADFKQKEAALTFSSGFQANATVLPALTQLDRQNGETALIFSDALNHASIIHGCRCSAARTLIFRHRDLEHLNHLLQESAGHAGMRLIVTESVFSMDGDRADLPGLVTLAERHGALLYVDEAHASGVLGPGGRGLAAECGGVDIVMGTLGKAFGAFGAYVAGSRPLIDYLINRCSGFIYTTAMPPAVLGAVDAALDLLPRMNEERQRLAKNADRVRTALRGAGYGTQDSSTQIIPAVIGSEADALAASARLEAEGILAIAIRPPTVPPGTSRLRFALNSTMSETAMLQLLDAIASMTAE